jgi:hypothetical protein
VAGGGDAGGGPVGSMPSITSAAVESKPNRVRMNA